MLYNIRNITSKPKLYITHNYRAFCFVTIFMLHNKKVCYIARPNLPDGELIATLIPQDASDCQ